MAIDGDGAYTRARSRPGTPWGSEVASETAGTRMRRDDAVALLRENGIVPTAQRVDIASVLTAQTHGLPPGDSVYSAPASVPV